MKPQIIYEQSIITLGALFAGAMLILLASYGDQVDLDEQEYCRMVKIYDQTGGKHGWPPYKQGVECKEAD